MKHYDEFNRDKYNSGHLPPDRLWDILINMWSERTARRKFEELTGMSIEEAREVASKTPETAQDKPTKKAKTAKPAGLSTELPVKGGGNVAKPQRPKPRSRREDEVVEDEELSPVSPEKIRNVRTAAAKQKPKGNKPYYYKPKNKGNQTAEKKEEL